MGTITKEFAETLLKRVQDGKHINTTVHEEEQLIRAWLYWHENYYRPRIEAFRLSAQSTEMQIGSSNAADGEGKSK